MTTATDFRRQNLLTRLAWAKDSEQCELLALIDRPCVQVHTFDNFCAACKRQAAIADALEALSSSASSETPPISADDESALVKGALDAQAEIETHLFAMRRELRAAEDRRARIADSLEVALNMFPRSVGDTAIREAITALREKSASSETQDLNAIAESQRIAGDDLNLRIGDPPVEGEA